MQRKIPMEQLTLFLSSPDPRTNIPEENMNNQESTKMRRTHIRGQETSLSVKFPRSSIRLEMRCARMETPRRLMIALRTLVPAFGVSIPLGVLSIRFREGEGRS